MSVTDDTQPRSPFKNQGAQPQYVQPEEEPPTGPGCLVWSLVAVVCLGCAAIVVVLAGTAGWRDGRRIADVTSTSEIAATADSQLTHIPQDVQNGNLYMLDRRVKYLETLLPDMPGLPGIIQTATALYQNSLPTATPTAQPSTPTSIPTTAVAPTLTSEVPVESTSAYDLGALLQEARDEMNQNLWSDAISTLDVIIALDSNFEPATVNGLMLQALRTEARNLYNDGKLAEAILLTTRAEDFGLSADDDLRYEQYVAGLYLDAMRTIGIDYLASINALRKVYDLGPGRYYDEVSRLLFQQYTAYGDAWAQGQDYCQAFQQYQNALTIRNSPQVVSKRDSAETACAQGTPVPGDGSTQPIAPVGVIETPGN
jgi:tetratricopeptide (TPR) repeat protein